MADCICCQCIIHHDDFTNDHLSDATWYSSHTSWSVSGGFASTTTANQLLAAHQFPIGSLGGHITVKMKLSDTATAVQFLISGVAGITIQAGAPGTVTIFDSGATTLATSPLTLAADAWADICFSIRENGVNTYDCKATFSTGSDSANMAGTFTAGGVGFGAKSAAVGRISGVGTITIDELYVKVHKVDDSQCSECTATSFGCTATSTDGGYDELQCITATAGQIVDFSSFGGAGIGTVGCSWRILNLDDCIVIDGGAVDGAGALTGLTTITNHFPYNATYCLQIGCPHEDVICWPPRCADQTPV